MCWWNCWPQQPSPGPPRSPDDDGVVGGKQLQAGAGLARGVGNQLFQRGFEQAFVALGKRVEAAGTCAAGRQVGGRLPAAVDLFVEVVARCGRGLCRGCVGRQAVNKVGLGLEHGHGHDAWIGVCDRQRLTRLDESGRLRRWRVAWPARRGAAAQDSVHKGLTRRTPGHGVVSCGLVNTLDYQPAKRIGNAAGPQRQLRGRPCNSRSTTWL